MVHKKICFVVSAFSDGGVNRVIANLSNAFVQRGIEVDVIALSSKYSTAKKLYASEVNLMTIDGPRAFSFIPLWKFFSQNSTYDAIISSVDFVNVHTVLAYKLAKINSVLIVITHTDLSEEKKQIRSRILKVVYKLSGVLYPSADHICAVSNGVAASMHQELGLSNIDIQVIYNPIVHQKNTETPPHIPHHWYQEDTPVLIGCGRLTKQKNFQLLIKAFALLHKDHSARLIILGDGEQKNALQLQIDHLDLADHVELVGNVANPLDYFYYSRAFIMTSLWEGFGNVIVEALSMGCPIVSTDCPSGPSEILENGKYGRLVKSNDEIALHHSILDELHHEKPSREYLQGRANNFRVDTIADQYLALIYSTKQLS